MGYIEVTVKSKAENEELLTWQMLEAGAQGIAVEDPAVIRAHLLSKSWDASVFDGQKIETGIITLRGIFPDDEHGRAAVEGLKQVLAAENPASPNETDTPVIRKIPDQDWQSKWKEGFHARNIGEKFYLTPLWLAGETIPEKRQKLVVEPGMAFGTGDHATTALALTLMEEHIHPQTSLLDMGCGSGILAIGGLLLGAKEAVAVDIDPICREAVEQHCRINNIEPDKLTLHIGDIFSDTALREKICSRHYDLILVNINAAIVEKLIPPVSAMLEPGGHFIATGIVDIYQKEVEAAFAASPLKITKTRRANDWLAYEAVL